MFKIHVLLLCVLTTYASIQKTTKEEMNSVLNSINLLNSKITSLDKKLDITNNSYIHALDEIKNIQIEFENVKNSNKDLVSKLEEIEKKISKNFLNFAASSNVEGSKEYLANKVYLHRLKLRLQKRRKLYGLLTSQSSKIYKFEKVIEAKKNNLKILSSTIIKMENLKDKFAKSYLELKNKQNTITHKLSKYEFELANQSKTDEGSFLSFHLDKLKSFFNNNRMKASDNGVLVSSENEVVNPIKGTVAYVGALSNYGRIIIIDHENSMKSVFLGEITETVRMGESVLGGQRIASIEKDPTTGDKSYYFEFRKGQKTINLNKFLRKI